MNDSGATALDEDPSPPQRTPSSQSKPHPDLFLAAARALEVDPARCVAFEDAVNGVRAARAAGMQVAAVLTTTPARDLLDAGARWTLRDFQALPDDLEAALRPA